MKASNRKGCDPENIYRRKWEQWKVAEIIYSQDVHFATDTSYARPPARIIVIGIPIRESPMWI